MGQKTVQSGDTTVVVLVKHEKVPPNLLETATEPPDAAGRCAYLC